MRALLILLAAALLGLAPPRPARAGELSAFSLRQAEAAVRAGDPGGSAARLDGLTRLVAAVVDEAGGDVVLLGEREARPSGLRLDDLVVALRARLLHHRWPLVSIDRAPDTASTGRQVVRFDGGPLAQTGFGRALFDADVALKKLALELVSAQIWGVPSYFALCRRAAAEGELEDRVASRFWFRPLDASQVVVREGVAVIQDFRLGVQAEVLSVNGQPPTAATRDVLAERFAAALSARLDDVQAYFPEAARLARLFELVALARGLELQARPPPLDYWLSGHRLAAVDTPATYPLLERSETVATPKGERRLDIDGGVELRAGAIRLRGGDVTALREIVLRSRPAQAVLSWKLPVALSRLPGMPIALHAAADPAPAAPRESGDAGTTVQRRFGPLVASAAGLPAPPPQTDAALRLPPWRPVEPALVPAVRLPAWKPATSVGGVTLEGVARIADEAASPSFSGGRFGLLVEGELAQLEPQAFRRFVTALWAVYFSDGAPGLSIDPIAPGLPYHRVRYIGQVVNTDLGRVMREADHRMKRAAVGTEALDVPGFMDVDQLSARHGLQALGLSRRFWFKPRDMRLRRAGESLMFDSARMVLDTEITDAPGRSSAADRAFADFFTRHYAVIARRHPVYGELLEYAKLVSLASWVKERRLPLLWFLLAHKHEVLTEDSPATVRALVKGSRHRNDMRIEGGVEMRSRAVQVPDRQLARALERTTAAPVAGASKAAGVDAPNVSVLPAQAQGLGPLGLRFQTDLALHDPAGRPGLELVRYFDASRSGGEFGPGWHVLVPYAVHADGTETLVFRGARLPRRMQVEGRLSGRRESLVFDTRRHAIAGWVPESQETSEFVGLFPLSDGTFRLLDKLGAEFVFDRGGRLTRMELAERHVSDIGYLSEMVAVGPGSVHRVEPAGPARRVWRGIELPERLRLRGLRTAAGTEAVEPLMRLREHGATLGWEPEGDAPIRFLALLADGSLRGSAIDGSQWLFDAGGTLQGVRPAPEQGLVQRIAFGTQQLRLDYELDAALRLRVARARFDAEGVSRTLSYHYDGPGRLAQALPAP
ncbi:MAG: hypothetical protein AB7F93_09845 [Immundisolibacter sp.]|uniref:hypothetical protein n=1 Tax=Immundisolibacter sp. TaxID=1934948 RepID=UPI003D0B57BC